MALGRAARRQTAVERSLVLLLGSPRTGSTWLLNLLLADPGVATMDEPLVGAHLGLSAAASLGMGGTTPARAERTRAYDRHQGRDDYFFAERSRAAWAPALRALLLARFEDQLVRAGRSPGRDLLVVKEPHGSEAADLLSSALPGARLLVLVRDGRDVVDSLLDALAPGSWASDVATVDDLPGRRRAFLEEAALAWVERMRVVEEARAGHDQERVRVVQYEALLAEPLQGLRDVFGWLGRPEPEGLQQHVERLAFEAVPAELRGPGRFHRAATPGLWREHLTADEQQLLDDLMGPALTRLGYEVSAP